MPKLLPVDELSFGLAPIIVDRLLERVKHMAVERGVAILLVEQHVGHALRFADRAYVMSRGRIVLDEPAASLLASPELLASSYLGEAS
jgi:branched-chain amino acid transport system ATP-binding protein